MTSDGIQGIRTGSCEPVLRISARLANPLLTLRNLRISISLCLMQQFQSAADVSSECKERF